MAITAALLDALVPSARVALPFVERMVAEGLSATVIQDTLGELGSAVAPGFRGVRRTDLLSLIRGIKDIAETGPFLRSVRDDRTPDPARLKPPVTTTLRTYSFKVAISGIDPETGEEKLAHVTISTERLLTAGQIKAAALGMVPRAEFEVGPGSISGPIDDPRAVVVSGTSRA